MKYNNFSRLTCIGPSQGWPAYELLPGPLRHCRQFSLACEKFNRNSISSNFPENFQILQDNTKNPNFRGCQRFRGLRFALQATPNPNPSISPFEFVLSAQHLLMIFTNGEQCKENGHEFSGGSHKSAKPRKFGLLFLLSILRSIDFISYSKFLQKIQFLVNWESY